MPLRAESRRVGCPGARSGFTLVELMVSLLLLGICLLILARMAMFNRLNGIRLIQRALALEHATDAMEELRTRPWDQLQNDIEEQQPLPDHLKEVLFSGEVSARVTAEPGIAARCRRITVEVRWKGIYGPESVELIGFRAPRTVSAPLAN